MSQPPTLFNPSTSTSTTLPSSVGYVPPVPSPDRKSGDNKISYKFQVGAPGEHTFGSYKDLIIGSNIDNELSSRGYNIVYKIIINGDVGKYLRATNPCGRTVFILLDTDGYISSMSSTTMEETTDTNIISGSLRDSIFRRVRPDLLGAVIENACNIHVLFQSGVDTLPQEVTYSPKPMGSSQAPTEVISRFYPLLRMSDIRENPDEVLRVTTVVAKKLVELQYKDCIIKLATLEKVLTQCNRCYSQLAGSIEGNYSKMVSEIDAVETTVNPSTVSTKSELREKLVEKHYQLQRLFDICSKLTECTFDLQVISNKWTSAVERK